MRYMIGIDVGGTFTDLTFVDVLQRHLTVHKLPSTPHNPSEAIITGIREVLASQAVSPESVDYLAHGTTVATNALIERTGARTGLIVTTGFRDLLEIGDQTRPSLYNIRLPKPEVFVPGERRLEVRERVYADGRVRTPLDPSSLQHAISALKAADVEAVAICFLFSYVNAEHEEHVRAAVQEALPDVYITASHEIVPEFREYARLSTTVLNAYLGPVMQRYLQDFEAAVGEMGIHQQPYVTQSNGGILSIGECIRAPIRTAVSGPSAGVVGALYTGQAAGFPNLITLDLGGTSADISLIDRGDPLLSMERKVEGFPARIPMMDIATIGAGGGSIAWIDPGGALKVGPRSAGAAPGPACYGLGGTLPTVTDANAVLGRINPGQILGGRLSLDLNAAKKAIQEHICQHTGLNLIEAASGVIRVVNANMVRAIRRVTVERGYNPQDFALMAFGGAGPLHAVAVARELGVKRIIVPASPGTLCSLGLLVTDIKTDYVRSKVLEPNAQTLPLIAQYFADMASEAEAMLEREAIPQDQRSLSARIEARYKRQNYEIAVPVTLDELTPEGIGTVIERFHSAHERLYGYARPSAPLEFVNFRLTAIGVLPKAPLPSSGNRDGAVLEPIEVRPVYLEALSDFRDCPVYHRDQLFAGDRMEGPTIIEQLDSTTFIPAGVSWSVDAYRNIILELGQEN